MSSGLLCMSGMLVAWMFRCTAHLRRHTEVKSVRHYLHTVAHLELSLHESQKCRACLWYRRVSYLVMLSAYGARKTALCNGLGADCMSEFGSQK